VPRCIWIWENPWTGHYSSIPSPLLYCSCRGSHLGFGPFPQSCQVPPSPFGLQVVQQVRLCPFSPGRLRFACDLITLHYATPANLLFSESFDRTSFFSNWSEQDICKALFFPHPFANFPSLSPDSILAPTTIPLRRSCHV